MLEMLRKYVEAGMGALTSERAQQLARALVKRGQAGREQASRVAREMVEWSKANRERMTDLVRREVKKQLDGLGVATKREISSLKTRLSRLEARAGDGGSGTRSRSAASRGTARSSGAKAPGRKAAKTTTPRTRRRREASGGS